MNPLAIALDLAIEYSIFIPRPHFLLDRHLALPALQRFGAEALLGQRVGDGRYKGVDGPEPFPLTRFLGVGETPGDFLDGRV